MSTKGWAIQLDGAATTLNASAAELGAQLKSVIAQVVRSSPSSELGRRVSESVNILIPYFLRAIRSAELLLNLREYPAAGAVARKALEILYALRIIGRQGENGIQLIEIAGTRNVAGLHKKTIQAIEKAKQSGITGFDDTQKTLGSLLKKIKKIVPNGDTSRVEPKTMAEWAGLIGFHNRVYADLNANAHFDLIEANELASEKTGGALMRVTIARRYFNVAKHCCEIMAYALGAMSEFGDPVATKTLPFFGKIISNADKQVEQSLKICFEIMPRFASIDGE